MRWGLLGTARINQKIIPYLKSYEQSDLVAVASRDFKKAQEYAKNHEIQKAYGSYEELLGATDVEAIYISLPNHLHVEWAQKALESGKHVLCEKPISLRAEDIKKLSEISQQRDLILAEAFMYRHQQQTKAIKKIISQGLIGQIKSIKASFHFVLKDDHDIRLNKEMGGGSLWDIGCYPINLLRYLVGSLPTEVFGWSTNKTEQGVDRQFVGLLKFPNQISGTIECSFDAPANHFLEIIGTEGALRVQRPFKAQEKEKILIIRENQEEQIEVNDSIDPYMSEVIDFTESVSGKKSPEILLTESHDTILMIESLYRSWTEKRPIKI